MKWYQPPFFIIRGHDWSTLNELLEEQRGWVRRLLGWCSLPILQCFWWRIDSFHIPLSRRVVLAAKIRQSQRGNCVWWQAVTFGSGVWSGNGIWCRWSNGRDVGSNGGVALAWVGSWCFCYIPYLSIRQASRWYQVLDYNRELPRFPIFFFLWTKDELSL